MTDNYLFWNRWRLSLAVVILCALQWTLGVTSLVQENPTVDEVVHLPAGISYCEQGTFRLYPHNPPLVKLITGFAVRLQDPQTDQLYSDPDWGWATSNKTAFAHGFMLLNADRLLELCRTGRLLMPFFATLGGLVVFDWSRRLWGNTGGLLSLGLWSLSPNILAHSRLITTDVAATSVGLLATYFFWHYLKSTVRTWKLAVLVGILLGIGQLTKFSLLVLYAFWPLLWIVATITDPRRSGWFPTIGRGILHGFLIVFVSILMINIGYGFEGFGKALGSYPFTSKILTIERESPIEAPGYRPFQSPGIREGLLQFRVNRFRGTFLESLPTPLPQYYLSGFDDQKTEAEGIPAKARRFLRDADQLGSSGDETIGYPVYLDGELQSKSWWYYYLLALCYKVPEGTGLLWFLTIGVALFVKRARGTAVDELALWAVPLVVVAVMSFGTNIALGLRYVLPIFPYLFISLGRLAPWIAGISSPVVRRISASIVGGSFVASVVATVMIHPHYLAYFNWSSGGGSNGSSHLIDSNLDWGQDLVGLKRWLDEHAPEERVGIAYFGQIPPNLFNRRGEPLDWFLPPARPGGWGDGPLPYRYLATQGLDLPEPGLYAVSATLLRGLPWRVYDSGEGVPGENPDWRYFSVSYDAYSYFQLFEPIAEIGHSILIFRLDSSDIERLKSTWAN